MIKKKKRLTKKPTLDFAKSRGDDVLREIFQMVKNLADEDDNKGNTPSVNRVEDDAATQMLAPVSGITWPQVTVHVNQIERYTRKQLIVVIHPCITNLINSRKEKKYEL